MNAPYYMSRAEAWGLGNGYYTDAYFNYTRTILKREGYQPHVCMQVFQRHNALLAGMDEALAIIRRCAGPASLKLASLRDGDQVKPWETVLTIDGDYSAFAHLETPILGVLARRTAVATETRAVVDAADGKPVYYFGARHDDWRVQEGDGYAALVGGASSVSTDANGHWSGQGGIGTIPHALIAAYRGSTVRAAEVFAKHYADQMPVTVLVDFDNDCARTAVQVADALGPKLSAVRLDTSGSLIDAGVEALREQHRGLHTNDSPWIEHNLYGVCPPLVDHVRSELDAAGHQHVKIVVSGGFTAAKVQVFEGCTEYVDAYGVGSSILRARNDFTADIVEVDGVPCAKVGRQKNDTSRLREV